MRRAAAIALRGVPGALFVWAGWSKLGSPLLTLASIYSYQIVLPDWLATAIATTLPWMEILIGLALLAGFWLPAALGWAAALLVAFTALTAQAWWRDLPIDCGCVPLGSLHPVLEILTTPGGAVIRNTMLLAMIVSAGWLSKQPVRRP